MAGSPAFATLLRTYRRAAGLTQAELADRADLSERAVSDLERGLRRRPYPHTVAQLAVALGLSAEERDRFVAAARRPRAPAVRPADPPTRIRFESTVLFGREREAALAADLLARDSVRLLTLTGVGGVGKTSLAREIAARVGRRLRNGVIWIGLGAIERPEHFPARVASGLGLRAGAAADLLRLLVAALEEQQLLLVLDNFEHLLPAADHVAALLAACPGLKILVTSRSPLHLRAEQELPVPPLPVPDGRAGQYRDDDLAQVPSVALLLARLRAVRPDLRVDRDTLETLAEICRRLDGLPLAIELAAARGKVFPPRALLTQLTHPLNLLNAGARDLPARQRTLRATLDWSAALLTSSERALFARLGVFAGSATLAAVTMVCNPGDPAGLLDDLTTLVDQSLLRQVGTDEPRFAMLETVREYAAERLAALGEDAATRATHARYYLNLAEDAEPRLFGPDQGTWLDRLEAEHDNLRAAVRTLLDMEEAALALRLLTALGRYLIVRGYPGEGAAWLDEALEQAHDVTSAQRARGLATAGYLRWVLSEHGRSRSLTGDAVALFREQGDEVQVAFCLNLLGNVAVMQARFAEAQTRFAQSLALSEQAGPPAQAATTRANLGLVAAWRGDHARGAELLEAGIAGLEELGVEWAAAYFRCCLALLYRELGELDRAESMAREGLRAARAVGYVQARCFGLIAVGEVAAARGELDLAADQLEAAVRETQRWGSVAAVKMAQSRLGAASVALGNHERAREVLDDALRSSAQAAPNFLPGTLETVAWLVAERGTPGRAAALWGGADRLRETLRIPAWPFERTRSTVLQHEFRRRLGDARWVANWQAGQGLTEPDLIAAARAALADLWPHGAADTERAAPSEPVREIAQTDGGIRYVGTPSAESG